MKPSEVAALYARTGKPAPAEFQSAADIRGHKYSARKKIVDGITFHSTIEAESYTLLKLWELCGHITGLQLQPKFRLQDAFVEPCGTKRRAIHYIADFRFLRDGIDTVVDAKGMRTAHYRDKAKMFLKAFPDLKFEEWDRQTLKSLRRI